MVVYPIPIEQNNNFSRLPVRKNYNFIKKDIIIWHHDFKIIITITLYKTNILIHVRALFVIKCRDENTPLMMFQIWNKIYKHIYLCSFKGAPHMICHRCIITFDLFCTTLESTINIYHIYMKPVNHYDETNCK